MGSTLDLPGGGTAEFYDPLELTPRRRRPVQTCFTALGNIIVDVADAAEVTVDGETVDASATLKGPRVEVSLHNAELMDRTNDTVAWALLKSWTLDRPLPPSADALLDLDMPLYNAIRSHAAQAWMGTLPGSRGGFDIDSGIEDPGSPTGP